jgi:ABC-type sugar transport system substrate-binding protein
MKKRVMVSVLCVVFSAFLFAACTQSPAPASDTAASSEASVSASMTNGEEENETNSEQSNKDVKLALVMHALNSSFFTKMQSGAEQAGKDLGIQVDVMAPATMNSLDEQVSMIESCIAAGYDGIATVVWDPEGFNDVIQKAKDAGICVIGLNQDAPDSGREAFVGQDLELSAYEMAKYFFENEMKGEGTYIIASCAPTNTALILRQEGVERAAKEFPNIKEKPLIDIGTDLTTAVGVIESAYLANPDVTAFIGVDAYSEAIGTFIQSQNLNGQVFAAGNDLAEGTIKHIKNNAMQLTVGQNPFLQGYYPIVEMYLKVAYDYVPVNISTGAFFVTKDNVDNVQPE